MYTYICIHLYINIHTKNMFPKVGLLEKTKEEGKEEMSDNKWITSQLCRNKTRWNSLKTTEQ
jgi:hypothetical protein